MHQITFSGNKDHIVSGRCILKLSIHFNIDYSEIHGFVSKRNAIISLGE